jgi:hypothetical protein
MPVLARSNPWLTLTGTGQKNWIRPRCWR